MRLFIILKILYYRRLKTELNIKISKIDIDKLKIEKYKKTRSFSITCENWNPELNIIKFGN